MRILLTALDQQGWHIMTVRVDADRLEQAKNDLMSQFRHCHSFKEVSSS